MSAAAPTKPGRTSPAATRREGGGLLRARGGGGAEEQGSRGAGEQAGGGAPPRNAVSLSPCRLVPLSPLHAPGPRSTPNRATGIRRSSHGLAAFTLVEVLAALLLVAIVLPVVMQGVSLATTAASSARRRTEAASLAQSKLAEILATEGWRGGVLSGYFSAADGYNADDYGWRVEVIPWTPEPYVRQLTVHVTWDRAGGEQSVTLTTLVYEGRPEDDDDDADATADPAGATGGTS